jgi:putative ABC transport system ATP-binding protein
MTDSAKNNNSLIRLNGVKKIFFADEVETHALSGINMEIRRGEYVAISGPSGCGKSTLLSILGLLDTPSDGEHFLKDEPVENLSASQRARVRNREIGFVFQAFNLIGDLNVYENVELPLTYRGMPSKERKERRNFPAVSSSAWPWRAPLSATRRSCSPTSPPGTSTRKTARPSWT